jgi:hypothetical protein
MFHQSKHSAHIRPLNLLSYFCVAFSLGCAATSPPVTHAPRRSSECPGTVIRSKEQLETLAGCEVIRGSLTISGTALTDLLPLSGLRAVTGELLIAGNSELRLGRSGHGLHELSDRGLRACRTKESAEASLFLDESDGWTKKYARGSLKQKRVELLSTMDGATTL